MTSPREADRAHQVAGSGNRTDPSDGWLAALPGLIVRYRGSIALAWLVAIAVLVPSARHAASVLSVSTADSREGEGAEAERILLERFDSPYARYAVLVLTGVPAPDSPEGRGLLAEVVGRLESEPAVTRTLSFLSTRDRSFVGPRSTFVLVGLAADEGRRSAIDVLRATTSQLAREWRSQHPNASLAWTGAAALEFDVRAASSADAAAAERRALPLTLLLLVLAFGSFGAALLPVATAALAIALCLGAGALIAPHWPLTVLLINIVSMLGLGVGIDYALLMIHRFREALGAGLSRQAAAEESIRHAGHAVVLSGVSVAVGFAALLAVPAVQLRSVAVGGLLVVTVSGLLAVTLLPGVLAQVGSRIDVGRVRWSPLQLESEERWRRWGGWVAARPIPVLLAAGLPILLLTLPVGRLLTSLPSGDWLPSHLESARANAALRLMGGGGYVQTVRLIVRLPRAGDATGPEGWRAITRVTDVMGHDPRIERVLSLPTLLASDEPDPLELPLVPVDLLGTYLSSDRDHALVELVPRGDVSPAELVGLVRELRERDPVALTGVPGTRLFIAGLPALNADYEDAIGSRTPLVVMLVIGGTLVALLVGFRSLLVPVKAVLLNLVSVVGAFGAAVLVFQDGHGAGLLGLAGPVDGMFPAVPIIVFCIVFGLSMDYEVFLMTRIAEFHRAGLDDGEALAEGMARTAGVITSAAGIMITVFACFALGDFLIIKILGFCLATAILLDVTLVRMAIGPAVFGLAGRWNWWPRERAVVTERLPNAARQPSAQSKER